MKDSEFNGLIGVLLGIMLGLLFGFVTHAILFGESRRYPAIYQDGQCVWGNCRQ